MVLPKTEMCGTDRLIALKENNLLIIPDLPGSGSSEMLEGKVSIEDYAEVLKALADEVIFQKRRKKS